MPIVQIKALNKHYFDSFDIQAIVMYYITVVYFNHFNTKKWPCDGPRWFKLKKMSKCQKDVKMSKRCQNVKKMSKCQKDVKCQKVKHTDYGRGSQKNKLT